MEKKYEYKLKDEKYLIVVRKITECLDYSGVNLQSSALLIKRLDAFSALDLFFDKVEVSFTSMTTTLKGKLTIQLHPTSQVENLKSNGWKITTEEHVNQIRKYLNK